MRIVSARPCRTGGPSRLLLRSASSTDRRARLRVTRPGGGSAQKSDAAPGHGGPRGSAGAAGGRPGTTAAAPDARLQPVGAPVSKHGRRTPARARAPTRALRSAEGGRGWGCGDERRRVRARVSRSRIPKGARTSSAFASWTPRAEPSAIRLMSSFSTSSARSVIASARRALSVPASSPTRSKLPPPEKHESHMERGCAARDPHVVDKPSRYELSEDPDSNPKLS